MPFSPFIKPLIHNCVFCKQSPTHKEHIYPRWSHRYITKSTTKYQSLRAMAKPDRTFSQHHVFKRAGDIHDWQVKCVCQPHCNGGWMKKLEDRVKPIMIPLIEGAPARLSPDDQRAIAAWAALKAIVAEYDGAGTRTTHHMQRKYLMRHGSPPLRTWKIWIGHFERKQLATHFSAHPFPYFGRDKDKHRLGTPTEKFNSQITTYILGKMFLHIVHTPMTFLIKHWHFHSRVATKLRVIWPPTNYGIVWPPPAMGDADAHYIDNAIIEWLYEAALRALKGQKALPRIGRAR